MLTILKRAGTLLIRGVSQGKRKIEGRGFESELFLVEDTCEGEKRVHIFCKGNFDGTVTYYDRSIELRPRALHDLPPQCFD